ncbi:MAG: hypothetical protein ACK4UK_02515 [Flavobacterium sp.]
MNLTTYYEKKSYAEKNIDVLKKRVQQHLTNTLNFIGVDTYNKPIHYFLLDDKKE